MKSLVSFDQEVGGDGLMAKGALGVEGVNLVAQVQMTYPLEKVVEPVMQVVDSLLDKVEAWIPGDQKAMAAQFKLEAREQLVKLLAEEAAPAPVNPA